MRDLRDLCEVAPLAVSLPPLVASLPALVAFLPALACLDVLPPHSALVCHCVRYIRLLEVCVSLRGL